MLFCRLQHPTPCIQYDNNRAGELAVFLRMNHARGFDSGDQELIRFYEPEIAHFMNCCKAEKRAIYVKHGSWVRCINPGQFSVCSDETFRATYSVVEENKIGATPEPETETVPNFVTTLTDFLNRKK